MRIGQSIDIHQLVNDRDLIIGGVEIDYHLGLLGHSDADVLCHAIAEALIGALGLGDLGTHFPDNDSKYKNICSLFLLKDVTSLLNKHNYEIINIDSIVIIEKPKLAPYIPQMKENIANALNISTDSINIKATRAETLGFIGSQEGAVSQAVVLIKRKDEN